MNKQMYGKLTGAALLGLLLITGNKQSHKPATMKSIILTCLAAAAFLSFSACETENEHRHGPATHSTTTTTEETTTTHPIGPTTETRMIRSY